MKNATGEDAIAINDVRKTFTTYEARSSSFLSVLSKRKTEKKALRGVSFSVKKGSITALLGKNGSGKSTLIKLLVGIMAPDSGTVRVLGMDPWKERITLARRMGVVLGAHPTLYNDLPPAQSFEYMRRLYRIPKNEYEKRLRHFIRLLELDDVNRRQVRELSLGERMKCNFIAAVLHLPDLIVLDEPTIGVDLPSTLKLRATALDLQKRYGTTILIATHILEDVKVLAEEVVILDKGKVVFNGSKHDLSVLFGDYKTVELYFAKNAKVNLSRLGTVVDRRDSYVKIEIRSDKARDKMLAELVSSKNVVDYNISTPEIGEVMSKFYSRVGGMRAKKR